MKKTTLLVLLAVFSVTAFQTTIFAQDTSKPKKDFKNNIHFNITNPIFFSRTIVIGYERVLNSRRSFTINFGQTGFPNLNIINLDSLRARGKGDQKGFHVSADYRFYLAKENKYNAPRGIYIGPYISHNYFQKEQSFDMQSTSGGNIVAETETSMNITTAGVQLGYQFVFWNRLSVDMILVGPGVAAYKLESKLGSNLSDADREKLFEQLNQALAEKFPGYSMVIEEGEFKKTGTTNTTNIGFRYLIQVGFRF